MSVVAGAAGEQHGGLQFIILRGKHRSRCLRHYTSVSAGGKFHATQGFVFQFDARFFWTTPEPWEFGSTQSGFGPTRHPGDWFGSWPGHDRGSTASAEPNQYVLGSELRQGA